MKTRIAFANITDVGLVRRQNEDRAIVCDPGEELASKMGYLIALADGMGGHAAGEVAAELALRELVNRYYSFEGEIDPENILRQVVGEVNASVFDEASRLSELNTMGTTLVCAVIRDNWTWIANVGDSRAYLIRSGMALRLTKDHSWAEENGLSEEEAKRTPFRNVITRAVGIAPEVKVDVFSELLRPRDVVLLCSDGLTKHVPDQLIGKTVSRSWDLRNACIALVRLAKQNGGTDNVTAVASRIIRVRERKGHLDVSRAFPGQIDQAQRAIANRRRSVIVGIALFCACALLVGLWKFGVLQDLGLQNILSPKDAHEQISSPKSVIGSQADSQGVPLALPAGSADSLRSKQGSADAGAESAGLSAERGRPPGSSGALVRSDSSGTQIRNRNDASLPRGTLPTSAFEKIADTGSTPVPLSVQPKKEDSTNRTVDKSASGGREAVPDHAVSGQKVGKVPAKRDHEAPTRQVSKTAANDSLKKKNQQTIQR